LRSCPPPRTSITGKPNTIVAVRGDDVFVRTDRTQDPAGERVPVRWVQDAADTLFANGRIGINTDEATHRSAFIGAVLSTLPGAIGLRRPTRVELGAARDPSPQLEPGRIYGLDELADAFGLNPAFFNVAGGMVPSTANSLLLMTHPGGGKSFDYGDYRDGDDLVYTVRGKIGNQDRNDARNLDVAEKRRPLFVFEATAPGLRRFLGRAMNVKERTGRAPDDNGEMRDVLLFRLRFEAESAAMPSPSAPGEALEARTRVARPFQDTPRRPVPTARPNWRTRMSWRPSESRPTTITTRSSVPSMPSSRASGVGTLRRFPAQLTFGRRGRTGRA